MAQHLLPKPEDKVWFLEITVEGDFRELSWNTHATYKQANDDSNDDDDHDNHDDTF